MRYEETTRAILDYLGVHVPAAQNFSANPKLKKMSDALNDEWVCRYHEIKVRQPSNNDRIRQHFAQWFVTMPKSSKQE